MFMDLLIIFILLSIIMFILSVFIMETENPIMAVPFIMVGMIFTILCAYGVWDVEFLYINFNATLGTTSASIYSTDAYGDPYSYIFMVFFFFFVLVLVKTGANVVKQALEEEKNNPK